MSMSKNMLDELPDELVDAIFRKLPLREFKTLAKVDKRSRRLVRELKPTIHVISNYDVEQCIKESNVLIRLSYGYSENSIKRFFKLFFELILNFKNVKVIQGSYLIHYTAMNIGGCDIGWKRLASMIPNIESLFGRSRREYGVEFSSGISDIQYSFMQHALAEDPTSNPCSKDVIGVDAITYDRRTFAIDHHRLVQFLDKHPHLTFKFASGNNVSFDRYLKIDNFETRLTRLELGIEIFNNLGRGISFPNVDLFKTNGRIDLETFPAKLSAILPNVKKLMIFSYNVEAINNIWMLCDNGSKITDLEIGNMPEYDPPIRQLYEIMSREDRNVEYVIFRKFCHRTQIKLHIIRKNLRHEMNLDQDVPLMNVRAMNHMFFETDNLVFAIETDEDRHDRPWWSSIRDMFINMPDINFDNLTQVEAQQVTQQWIQETCDKIVD